MNTRWALVVASGITLWGCSHSMDDLRARAAFDLRCAKDSLRITKIDDRTRGVRGCGQRATYIYSCEGAYDPHGSNCTWILNSDHRPR